MTAVYDEFRPGHVAAGVGAKEQKRGVKPPVAQPPLRYPLDQRPSGFRRKKIPVEIGLDIAPGKAH